MAGYNGTKRVEAWFWLETLGQFVFYTTPFLVGLLIYIYESDQQQNSQVNDKLFGKVEENKLLIKELNTDIQEMLTELARRGVRFDSLQKEIDSHFILIQDHESRIRTLELSPQQTKPRQGQ